MDGLVVVETEETTKFGIEGARSADDEDAAAADDEIPFDFLFFLFF